MSPNAVMAVAFFAGLASVSWSAAYAWGKWLTHRRTPPQPGATPTLGASDERLDRLEMMMESVAYEVERLGEAQRYTVRLLDERLSGAVPPAALPKAGSPPARVTTPH